MEVHEVRVLPDVFAGGYFQTGGVGEVAVLPTRLHVVSSQKTII